VRVALEVLQALSTNSEQPATICTDYLGCTNLGFLSVLANKGRLRPQVHHAKGTERLLGVIDRTVNVKNPVNRIKKSTLNTWSLALGPSHTPCP
jgi:hypothetical protein